MTTCLKTEVLLDPKIQEADIAVAAVDHLGQAFSDPQAIHNGAVGEIVDADRGRLHVLGPVLMTDTSQNGIARLSSPPTEPDYPFHDRTVRVTRCGRICIGKRKINLSQVFAGQILGLKEVDDQIWLVTFMNYDLGFFDREEDRVEPGPNPFAPEKV